MKLLFSSSSAAILCRAFALKDFEIISNLNLYFPVGINLVLT